jgi:hypothetical protein
VKAEEIRELRSTLVNPSNPQNAAPEAISAYMLCEIAAQLAELNERLESVMGTEARGPIAAKEHIKFIRLQIL